MSRSYKKHAYCGDKKDKELKRMANHKVRQYLKRNPEVTLKPSQFKRLFESWEICDYGWLCDWEEYWQFTNKGRFWRIWYTTPLWLLIKVYVIRVYWFKHKWQKLRIKMGHRYDWQDYVGLDTSEI